MRILVHAAQFATFALIVNGVATAADAAPDPRPHDLSPKIKKECGFVIENKSCFIELGVEGKALLPSIRVNSDAGIEVELRFFRSPFERIEFDATTTLQPEPDLGGAVMKQWIGAIGAIALKTKPLYANKSTGIAILDSVKSPLLSHDLRTICAAPYESFCDAIDGVRETQAKAAKAIEDWNARAQAAVTKLKGFKDTKSWPDPKSSDPWTALETTFVDLRREFGDGPVQTACSDRSTPTPARCQLPSGEVASARQQFELVRGIFVSVAPASTPIYAQMTQDILKLSGDQVDLENALTEAKQIQATLVALGDKLKEIKPDLDFRPLAVQRVSSPKATATTQIKVTETNIWSGKATNPAAPAIQWQDQKWELSAGVALSSLKKRSFAVTPRLDASGVPIPSKAFIAESSTSPNAFPIAFVHRRFSEEKVSGKRRTAWFGSIGLGVNDSSAEGMVGISYSYGSLFVMGGAHIGREKRLALGLTPGNETTIAAGDLAKFEDKSWVVRPAIALSYKVPVP